MSFDDTLARNVHDMASALADDPAAGHVRPRVATRSLGGTRARSDFTQYDREFSFECDESVERGGLGSAPSPLRYFLSGIAFCQQVWYSKGASLVGCELEDLVIEVGTYMDMRGEHRFEGIPPNPQWIVIEATIESPSPADVVLAMVDEANARCPLYSLVVRAIPVYERIRQGGHLIRDTVPEGIDA